LVEVNSELVMVVGENGPEVRIEHESPDEAAVVQIEERDEVAGEATVDRRVEALLQLEIEAEVYFHPSDVPAGATGVAPTIPETTTGAQEEPPAEATSGQ
jgi:hypothetical protein